MRAAAALQDPIHEEVLRMEANFGNMGRTQSLSRSSFWQTHCTAIRIVVTRTTQLNIWAIFNSFYQKPLPPSQGVGPRCTKFCRGPGASVQCSQPRKCFRSVRLCVPTNSRTTPTARPITAARNRRGCRDFGCEQRGATALDPRD